MSALKRFLMIVFGAAGVLCVCALALPWIGPYQSQAVDLMRNAYYYYGLQALLAITLAGLLATLLRGVFAPSKRETVTIKQTGGDKITVTTQAVSSQALYIVEASGDFTAEKIHISTLGNDNVTVTVRVRPKHTVNLANEGQKLHDDLVTGLAEVCGDHVQHVNLEFVEAESPIPAANATVEQLEVPQSVYERAALMQGTVEETSTPESKVEVSAPAPATVAPAERVESAPVEQKSAVPADDLEVPRSVYERAAMMQSAAAKEGTSEAAAAEASDGDEEN